MSSDPKRAQLASTPPVRSALQGARDDSLYEPDSTETTLADALWTIVENWRVVVATTVASVSLALVYIALAPPTYRSDVLLQVEDKSKTLPGLDDVQSLFGEKNQSDSEIEILRSRSQIGAVVDQLNLTVVAEPVTFPILGGAIARRYYRDGIAPPVLGLSRYAWGGERITVSRLDVPGSLLDRKLWLRAREGSRYDLFGSDDELLVSGEVGKAATVPQEKGSVTLTVAELNARPGTMFRLVKRRRNDVIEGLQSSLKVTEKGRKTGILVVSLEGPSPVRTAAILDSVARNYLRQNVERTSAEAAARLEFLQQQLPFVKKNLDRAEAELNAYQLKNGTVDLSMETQAFLDRAAEIEKSISELELSRAELGQRFTEKHPALLSVQEKSQKLRAERASMEAKLRALPEQEVTSVRLMRDVKVASELYFMMLNKSQELQVVKSGTIGNVRILDTAVLPYQPSAPKKLLVAALAILLGLAAGIAVAFVKERLDRALKDPAEIESRTGLAVYASIPHSNREVDLTRQRKASEVFRILANEDPTDLAIESLRSLRTSLQFARAEVNNNVIVIGGSSPSVGKTFVSVNLAHVLASTGSRVLLIDADLRRGKLHRFFGGPRAPGLSEVISGQLALKDVSRKSNQSGVEVIATGSLPPNPAELLSTERFRSVLAQASSQYDIVVIDAPPVLAVTDAAIVASHAGLNLLVLRAGRHPAQEIIAALKAFANAGVRVNGAVVNDVQAGIGGRYGRYAYNYSYQYDYRSGSTEDD